MSGKAPEYLEPLATLQENMQVRTKVAGQSDVQTEHGFIVLWNSAFEWFLLGNKVHYLIDLNNTFMHRYLQRVVLGVREE